MKRILLSTQRDAEGRLQYVAKAEGGRKEAVAETEFAAKMFAAKIALGIRRPRRKVAT